MYHQMEETMISTPGITYHVFLCFFYICLPAVQIQQSLELVLSARHCLKNFWSINSFGLPKVLGNRFYQPHFPSRKQALEVEVVYVRDTMILDLKLECGQCSCITWLLAIMSYHAVPPAHTCLEKCSGSCCCRRSIHYLTLSLFLSWLGHSCCFSNSLFLWNTCVFHLSPFFICFLPSFLRNFLDCHTVSTHLSPCLEYSYSASVTPF